jgi:tripartite-type tricarboxylate transporter receptor subunit TctC
MEYLFRINAALALLAACINTHAADVAASYPNRPIRFVVPYTAGGPTDLVAREIGMRLAEAWNQQVIIDNRAGAGTVLGVNIVAKASPDGYTILLGTSAGFVLNPLMTRNMPYDALKDFAPLSMAVISPQILAVNNQLPVTTVKDLIALAKAKPGQLNFASPGPGSPNHLGGELLKSMTGIEMVHVPYKGGVQALTDLVGGQVQLMFNSIPPVLPLAKAGKLRTIAIGSAKRLALLPDLPTVAETIPGFQCVTWYGVFAPAGTPRAIVDKLNTEIVQVLANPDVVQRFVAQGLDPQGNKPEQLTRFIRDEQARWKHVIASAHLAE